MSRFWPLPAVVAIIVGFGTAVHAGGINGPVDPGGMSCVAPDGRTVSCDFLNHQTWGIGALPGISSSPGMCLQADKDGNTVTAPCKPPLAKCDLSDDAKAMAKRVGEAISKDVFSGFTQETLKMAKVVQAAILPAECRP